MFKILRFTGVFIFRRAFSLPAAFDCGISTSFGTGIPEPELRFCAPLLNDWCPMAAPEPAILEILHRPTWPSGRHGFELPDVTTTDSVNNALGRELRIINFERLGDIIWLGCYFKQTKIPGWKLCIFDRGFELLCTEHGWFGRCIRVITKV